MGTLCSTDKIEKGVHIEKKIGITDEDCKITQLNNSIYCVYYRE